MTAPEDLLDAVCCREPKRVAAALQSAHGRGKELVPGIVARIEASVRWPSKWTGESNPDVGFLLFLAAEFRASAAHEPITRLLRLDDDRAYTLLGDIITEQAPAILADTYAGTPEPLLALVRDKAADPFARNAGLRALSILWKQGRYPRADLLELIAQLAATLDPDGENDPLVGNGLVDAAINIHATELRGTILGLYDRGLTELNYIEPEYAAKILASATPNSSESASLDRTITDAWQAVHRWYFFKPEYLRARAKSAATDHRHTVGTARLDDEGNTVPYRAPPKVGRNDPCPCGSGKKFKKCCGA